MKQIISIFLSIVLLSGCINEDIGDTLNKTHIKPEYSIPVGSLYYPISHEFLFPSSTTPGVYGIVYYEDNPYTLNSFYFEDTDTLNFNFNLNSKWIDNAERISFHLYTESSLPTHVITQVYFLDQGRNVIDSLNASGPVKINAGIVGSDGKVSNTGISSFDFPLTREQINRFSSIAYCYSRSLIQATKQGNDPVRFYASNKIDIYIGLRIKMDLGFDQL